MPTLLLSCIGLILLILSGNSFAKNSKEAADYLLQRINESKVYESWIKQECLIVETEVSTTKYHDLSIKEKHAENCAGDPSTAPIVDRFRVYSSNKILWYDLANDRFLPFKLFENLRKAK